MEDTNWWRDPDSTWWAKVVRAEEHIDALEAEVGAYLNGGGYRVEDEPGKVPGLRAGSATVGAVVGAVVCSVHAEPFQYCTCPAGASALWSGYQPAGGV